MSLESSPLPATNRIRTVLEMIKFEHSVVALPCALTGALLAARYGVADGGWPGWRTLLWIVAAMVGARSGGDDVQPDRGREVRPGESADARARALATGELSIGFAWLFTAASCVALLVLAAAELNRLALELSPIALGLRFLYSYTNR